MIEKLKTINPYDETEINMDTNFVDGLVYENTPLIRKINEIIEAINPILEERESGIKVYEEVMQITKINRKEEK